MKVKGCGNVNTNIKIANDIVLNDLQEQHRELAEIVGIENLIALSNHFGGMQLYIPQTDKLIKNAKYKAIIEEFDGFNIKKLAKKYYVSESTVYRLVRSQIVSNSKKQLDGQMSINDYGSSWSDVNKKDCQ